MNNTVTAGVKLKVETILLFEVTSCLIFRRNKQHQMQHSSTQQETTDVESDAALVEASEDIEQVLISPLVHDPSHIISVNMQALPPLVATDANHQTSFSLKWAYGLAIAASIVSHVCFGLRPPFSRHLQHNAKIPTMSLLLGGNLIALVVYLPRILYLLIQQFVSRKLSHPNEYTGGTQPAVHSRLGNILHYTKKYSPLAMFLLSLVFMSFMNVSSTYFTSAIYAQLISLSSPFIISVCSFLIMNRFVPDEEKERWSWKYLVAMIITVIGSCMIIIGSAVNKTQDETKWYQFIYTVKLDWNKLGNGLTLSDGIGMMISFLATVLQAVYIMSMRFMKNAGVKMSDELLFGLQELTLVIVFIIPCAIIDDKTVWAHLNIMDWIMFFFSSLCVYLIANLTSIYAIRIGGPSLYGNVLAIRLVSAVLVSGFIVDEWLQSVYQFLGICIVISSVSYFLYVRSHNK
jgi:drug/metabolite transporter (DMT)-like permease